LVEQQAAIIGAFGGETRQGLSGGRRTVIGAADSSGIDAIGPRVRSIWMRTKMESEVSSQHPGRGASIPAGAGSIGHTAMAESPRPTPELPPPDVKRWTIRRKAAVVTAIANGVLTREEACRRYQLSEEELLSWQQAYETHGLPGLRSTRLQQYRGRTPRD
jgi:Protein of unknown function (DUF1153)